jgi:hypothetical protein
MAHVETRGGPAKASALLASSRPPSPIRSGPFGEFVSLRDLKACVAQLPPAHPLRVLLSGEPDEIPRSEYAAKLVGWFRLAALTVD